MGAGQEAGDAQYHTAASFAPCICQVTGLFGPMIHFPEEAGAWRVNQLHLRFGGRERR
jgi:hypothetical protein